MDGVKDSRDGHETEMGFVCVMEDNLVYCMVMNHILLSVKPSPLILLVFLYWAAFYPPTNCFFMWMKIEN